MAMLFGPEAASKLGANGIEDIASEQEPTETINVNGVKPGLREQAGVDEILANGLGNSAILEQAQLAAEDAPQRKGMFGVKGTLRDIIGTLGDAFLVQSGNKAIYGPRRDQEKQADAMGGMTGDPGAAVERLASGGFADQARALYKEQGDRQHQQGTLQQNALRDQIAGQKDNRQAVKDGTEIFGRAAGALADNPNLAPVLIPIMERLKTEFNLGDEYVLPGEGSPEGLAAGYRTAGMPTTAQITGRQGDERIDIARQNAASAERNSRRPRQTRAPSNPTAASIAAPLLDQLERGEKLTPRQYEVLDRAGYDVPKASRGRSRPTAPPPASNTENWVVSRKK